MARGKAAKEGEAAATDSSNGKGISKMEGVRRTLDELGNNAKPLAIQEYLKRTYNIEMATTVISSYKTAIQKKGGRKGRKGGSRQATKTAAAASFGKGISMADILAVKELADRIGADKVRQLAEVLA